MASMTTTTTSEGDPRRLLSFDEVQKHSSADNCWVIMNGQAFDLSTFDHPGGFEIILKYAGCDATVAFNEMRADQVKGAVGQNSIPARQEPKKLRLGKHCVTSSTVSYVEPPLHSLISVHDFEDVARKSYAAKTFAFYSSGATDLITLQANQLCNQKILLRPRILRNVGQVNTKRRILGCDSDAPFFLSPAAMAKLAHPDGELAVTRGCANQGIAQVVSTNASYSLEDIIEAALPGQPLFLQLYVNSDRQKTETLLRLAKKLGIKAIFVTVDAPVPGKREADERIAAGNNVAAAISGAVATDDKKGGGLGRVMGRYIDPTLIWEDIAWIKESSGGLPIVLKGVQTAVDARKAVDYGVDGILLSNHGGRSLDTVQPAMLTLLELHKVTPEVFDRLEVYVDGGFTRGTDILKAVALGATAVGIGRSWLYAVNYGQEGVEHMCEILKDELATSMKLSGISDIDQAHPGMVNTAEVDPLIRSSESHPWIRWAPKARL